MGLPQPIMPKVFIQEIQKLNNGQNNCSFNEFKRFLGEYINRPENRDKLKRLVPNNELAMNLCYYLVREKDGTDRVSLTKL